MCVAKLHDTPRVSYRDSVIKTTGGTIYGDDVRAPMSAVGFLATRGNRRVRQVRNSPPLERFHFFRRGATDISLKFHFHFAVMRQRAYSFQVFAELGGNHS